MKAIYRNKKYECRLRVLLHDTNSSTSLLKHMNEKNIGFSDTATRYPPANIFHIEHVF